MRQPELRPGMKLEHLMPQKPVAARGPRGTGMKLVTTMIKPARLDDLHQELERIGISA